MIKSRKFDAMVGKTIAGVVVKHSSDGKYPVSQVFFEFTDGTIVELYSNHPIKPTRITPGTREGLEAHLHGRPGEMYEN